MQAFFAAGAGGVAGGKRATSSFEAAGAVGSLGLCFGKQATSFSAAGAARVGGSLAAAGAVGWLGLCFGTEATSSFVGPCRWLLGGCRCGRLAGAVLRQRGNLLLCGCRCSTCRWLLGGCRCGRLAGAVLRQGGNLPLRGCRCTCRSKLGGCRCSRLAGAVLRQGDNLLLHRCRCSGCRCGRLAQAVLWQGAHLLLQGCRCSTARWLRQRGNPLGCRWRGLRWNCKGCRRRQLCLQRRCRLKHTCGCGGHRLARWHCSTAFEFHLPTWRLGPVPTGGHRLSWRGLRHGWGFSSCRLCCLQTQSAGLLVWSLLLLRLCRCKQFLAGPEGPWRLHGVHGRRGRHLGVCRLRRAHRPQIRLGLHRIHIRFCGLCASRQQACNMCGLRIHAQQHMVCSSCPPASFPSVGTEVWCT